MNDCKSMKLTANRWPGGNNITSDKVPSEIAYSESSMAAEASDWSLIMPDAFDTTALKNSLPDSITSSGPDVR